MSNKEEEKKTELLYQLHLIGTKFYDNNNCLCIYLGVEIEQHVKAVKLRGFWHINFMKPSDWEVLQRQHEYQDILPQNELG